MNSNAYTTVILPTDASAKTEEALYEQYKQSNWWSQKPWLPVWVSGLYVTCVIFAVLWLDTENFSASQVRGLVGLIAFSLLVLMFGLLFLKHFTHDLPWEKHKETWRMNQNNCSSDIGGMLKIYD